METANPSKEPFAAATSPMCRRWLSADSALEPVTSDESVAYLLQQIFACTKVQKKLLAEFPSYLCSTCTSRLDLLDMYRSLCTLNNVKVARVKEELDTTNLTGPETTGEHSDCGIQQSDGVESVWIKTEVDAEDSEEDYQSRQTVYGYNRHDDLFEADGESLETLLKREPTDEQEKAQPSDADPKHKHNILKTNPFDVEREASVEGSTITPFLCEVCEKTFHAARNLRIHMQIHEKDQHQCPHCAGKFALRSHLKDHIRTHTGEKPFLSHILRIHMQVHNKNRLECPQCPSKFARQSHLKDHIRTHTGEKPFECEVLIPA
ncbi:zinc finger and SCAN domain-containing protein 25-like [Anopheles cruzii]|uniref:zinc finger and SCAN domain-containing protein 25-like n=1 Tax=Anopheles cruzii TaxID=68878 RepID=UPI0022EC80A0|nr:zinc finger and SCAN domain-containing protein 25-like [Anopheles cruzii]